MKKRKYILIIIIFICIIVSYVLFKINSSNKMINKEVMLPYGTPITINNFLKEDIPNAKCNIDLDNIKDIGTYEIKITINNKEYISNLIIYEPISNIIELKEVTIYLDEELPSINDFIANNVDLSNYEYEELSLNKELGTQDVYIKIYNDYDKYENTTKLNIIEDKEPPIFKGLTNITLEVGNKYNLYNNVEANDNKDGKVDFTIDDSKVNYNKIGTYKIYYTAVDKSGNKNTEIRKITITEKDITYKIDNFPTFNQYPNYPNGCESAALYNLLRFYNINVTISEIVNTLKKGEQPHFEDDIYYGGNPEIEFVGDPEDIHGYGVYQKPIIAVANNYKSGMIDYTGHSLDDVLSIVKDGIPVQIWASVNMQNTSVCIDWIYKETGEKINWLCKLHSVVVIGYNKNKVIVSDSYTGKIESYNRKQVEKIYNLYGKRAIYYPN